MASLQFFVQGSATEPYRITFEKAGDSLSADCTCPAGKAGRYCRHIFAVLSGITKGIVSDRGRSVATLKAWLAGTDVDDAMFELVLANCEVDAARIRVSDARKGLASALRRVSPRRRQSA